MNTNHPAYEKHRVFQVFVALFYLLLCFVRQSAGQVQPQETTFSQFESAFSHFAAQDKVVIVTEDAPFQEKLAEEQIRKLLDALGKDTPAERQQALANAYDYDCIQEGSVLILRKRFSNIEDLPYVPYEEVRSALDRIERSLASLNPPGPESGFANSAYSQWLASLTEEQMTSLKTKRPMEILTPEQRQLLRTVCAKDYMQTFSTLSRINTWYIKQLTEPETVFRWAQVIPDTPKILVLDGPLGFRGGRTQKGLSHGFVFQSGGPSILQNPRYRPHKQRSSGIISSYFIREWDAAQTKMWQDALTDLDDRTAPDPGAVPPPASSTRLTLAQVVDQLNARSGGQESYQLDPVLISKTVCLFGLKHATPRAIFESLATLYGLEISRPEDRVLRLTPPRLTRARDYSDVFKLLRRYFPAPYLRYYQAQFQTRMTFIQKPENLPDFAKRNPRFQRSPLYFASHATPYLKDTIYDIAVRRLRVEVEPQLKDASNGILKFSDAGVEVKRLFTLLCMVEIFSSLDETAGQLTTMGGAVDSDFGIWAGQFDSLMIEANVSSDRLGASFDIWDARGERVLYRKALGVAVGVDSTTKPAGETKKP